MSGYRPRRPSSKRSSDVTRSSAPPDPDRLTPVWVFLFKAGRRLRLGPGGRVWTASTATEADSRKHWPFRYRLTDNDMTHKTAFRRTANGFNPCPQRSPAVPSGTGGGSLIPIPTIHIIYIYK